ncbi:sulfite exporter TauE/SafE family protein [Pseudoflavonifractor capillosus]|uniref:sulfite exporter TauE/SafE family protein n=1 Tax=Pseudoflavonifractor capillosus TaxID=106588 RepID=UPI0023DF8ABD|nr:sulfite exporter TauE/SafE family protein [Pseudoflavonifractor capillosus]
MKWSVLRTLTRGDGVKGRSKYMITGLLAGAANGFFGAGGGLFLVPLFTRWLHLEQRRAFATSVAVVLPLSVAALVSYALEGGVDVGAALPYLAGGLVGGFLSGRVFEKIPVTWLRRGFGLLMLYGGVRAVLLL